VVWRRVALFFVLLILIGAIANATVPREKDAAPVETTPSLGSSAAPPADIVHARLPAENAIVAHVGNVVQIEVAHDAQDVVQVPALGIEEPVERGIDAQLVFDADRAGRFAVTLRDAGKRVGTLDVKEAG
jgi:hypothetical protein